MAFPWWQTITAGLNVGNAIYNNSTQRDVNKEQLDYNREMFEKQKARDLEFFNLQNDYNHPSAQMERFRQAGLNPNLVYGNGAVTQSATPHASSAASYNPTAPKIDLAGVAKDTMDMYFDSRIKEAQYDNLRAQNTDIANSAMLKSAQTMATLEQGRNTEFKTNFAKETAHITRAFMAEQANKMHYDQYQSQSAASVADEKNALSLDQLRESIKNIQSNTRRNEADTVLKEIEKNLRQSGVNPNDPMYMRMIMQILAGKGINVPGLFK